MGYLTFNILLLITNNVNPTEKNNGGLPTLLKLKWIMKNQANIKGNDKYPKRPTNPPRYEKKVNNIAIHFATNNHNQ